jgi:predicted outer membrane protein
VSVRRAAAALAALLATSCGVGQSDAPAASTPTTSASAAVAVLPREEVGQTHRASLGLIALGELGREKGSTQALRSLAARTADDGRSLDGQIREPATAAGLVLGDDVEAATQVVLTDLRARDGRDFDQAWLRAATTVVGQGREAADGVRSAPGSSREARSVATNVLARLAALSNALRNATTRAGAPTPTR